MQNYFAFFKKFRDFFRGQSDDERGLMERLRDKYRLVIMNDETFEEISSFRLTPMGVYIFLSSVVVGTAFLVVLLVVYTPLKRYIPGYGDYQRDEEIALLTTQVREMEKEINAHRRYNENIRKLLLGDLADLSKEAVAGSESDAPAATAVVPTKVDRIAEDDQLREEVERGNSSGSGAPAARTISAIGRQDISLEQLFFMPPVSGEITSPFDKSREHLGVDIAAPRNTAVKSAADGVVISAGYTVETGYSIAIQHPNNVVTMYKHNSVLLKKAGSSVKAGEAIAIVGNSGETTTGPHLHFELWHKGRAMNPGDYINFN